MLSLVQKEVLIVKLIQIFLYRGRRYNQRFKAKKYLQVHVLSSYCQDDAGGFFVLVEVIYLQLQNKGVVDFKWVA